jgi:hypothetical protein
MTFTEGAPCTSNLVFQDGQTVFLGQAAHCSGTGAATETNGCAADSLPLGTPVEVDGATRPGTLAYNSWITIQQVGESDEETCAYNDLALIRLDPADVPNVNPSVPSFGGPTGVGGWGGTGSTVYTYGNSSLRGGDHRAQPEARDRRADLVGRLEPRRLQPERAAGAASRFERGRRSAKGDRIHEGPRFLGDGPGARDRAVQPERGRGGLNGLRL